MGASANLVKVGNPVRMNAQLSDGENSLPRIVKGLVRNNTGSLVTEITLTHVGGGLFKDESYSMPELDAISVQYTVYDTDGITVDSSYPVGLDTFERVDKIIEGSAGGSISDDEFVVTYRDDPEFIVGVEDENS